VRDPLADAAECLEALEAPAPDDDQVGELGQHHQLVERLPGRIFRSAAIRRASSRSA
jgi:hypothetical protein